MPDPEVSESRSRLSPVGLACQRKRRLRRAKRDKSYRPNIDRRTLLQSRAVHPLMLILEAPHKVVARLNRELS